MSVRVEVATSADSGYLVVHDRHVSADVMARKIAAGEVLVLRRDETIVGWLRFGYFWDQIPFMNLIHVEEAWRAQGLGTLLVSTWEERMRADGHTMVLTSTLSDESAQYFYRKLGYRDAGALLLPGEVLEIILLKTWRTE